MKQIFLLGMLAGLSAGLYSCERAHEPDLAPTQETSAKPDTPQPEAPTSSTEGNRETPSAPRAADSIALESLGLRPLDMSPDHYPTVPTPPVLEGHDGPLPPTAEDLAKLPEDLVGIGSAPNRTNRIFWGYRTPQKIHVLHKEDEAVALEFFPEFNFRKYGIRRDIEDRPGVFDSLRRLHRDPQLVRDRYYLGPTPYDLRHMRIGYEGMDISPLFALSYIDYKPVTETRNPDDRVLRHVRVSDVSMDELDWLIEGRIHILPLTDRYPRFTLYFILRDGTVISKEIDMSKVPKVE